MSKFIITICFSFFSSTTYAHLKWFVEDQGDYEQSVYHWDWLIGLILLGGIGFVILTLKIHRLANKTNYWYKIINKAYPNRDYEWLALRLLLIIFLIANLFHSDFIAPNLIVNTDFSYILFIMQLFLALILTFSPLFSGLMIFFIMLFVMVFFPISIYIDYVFEFLALSIALILISKQQSDYDRVILDKFNLKVVCFGDYQAAYILRIGIGVQLMVLGIHNKLLDPGMGLVFLEKYPVYNFMQGLGFHSFSNLHFVFSAGIAETILGILILFGIATRFVMGLLALVFIITGYLSGINEVMGHLPIIGIAVIVLLYGKNYFSLSSLLCRKRYLNSDNSLTAA